MVVRWDGAFKKTKVNKGKGNLQTEEDRAHASSSGTQRAGDRWVGRTEPGETHNNRREAAPSRKHVSAGTQGEVVQLAGETQAGLEHCQGWKSEGSICG